MTLAVFVVLSHALGSVHPQSLSRIISLMLQWCQVQRQSPQEQRQPEDQLCFEAHPSCCNYKERKEHITARIIDIYGGEGWHPCLVRPLIRYSGQTPRFGHHVRAVVRAVECPVSC